MSEKEGIGTVIHLNLAEQQGFLSMIRERDALISRANQVSAMIEEAAVGVVQSRGEDAKAKWHLDAQRWELTKLPPPPEMPEPPVGGDDPPGEAGKGAASGDGEGGA